MADFVLRWWKQRRMRWAVKRHRQIHGPNGQTFLVTNCRTYRMLKRLPELYAWRNEGLGEIGSDRIVWRRLER